MEGPAPKKLKVETPSVVSASVSSVASQNLEVTFTTLSGARVDIPKDFARNDVVSALVAELLQKFPEVEVAFFSEDGCQVQETERIENHTRMTIKLKPVLWRMRSMYLPTERNGVRILAQADEASKSWRALPAARTGVGYRASKHHEVEVSGCSLAWGDVLEDGTDEGVGFVRFSLEPYIAVSGCQSDEREIVAGSYAAVGENHGRPYYKKAEMVEGLAIIMYFWDQRDGPQFNGWWVGPRVGGDQVWGFNPSQGSLIPPKSNWRVPFDGPPDDSIVIQAAQPFTLEDPLPNRPLPSIAESSTTENLEEE